MLSLFTRLHRKCGGDIKNLIPSTSPRRAFSRMLIRLLGLVVPHVIAIVVFKEFSKK